MDLISQHDPRWKDIKINGTNYTVDTDGCLICCLASAAGTTPEVVVKKIGFSGAQVSWTGLDKIGLELIESSNTYNDAKVKDYISQYGFCIVRVDWDGSPKTNDTHFVLFIGNKRMIDPWTGNECATSKYPLLTGFRAVRKIIMSDVIQVDQKVYGELVGKATKYDEFVKIGFDNTQKVLNLIDDYKKSIDNIKAERDAANNEATARRNDYTTLIKTLAEVLGTRQEAADVISQVSVDLNKAMQFEDAETKHKSDMEMWNRTEMELKAEIAKLKAIADQAAALKDFKTSDLLKEIIRRLTAALDLGRK